MSGEHQARSKILNIPPLLEALDVSARLRTLRCLGPFRTRRTSPMPAPHLPRTPVTGWPASSQPCTSLAGTSVPLAIKRRHSSKLIVPPAGTTFMKATSSFDLPLIRTLGKAFYWQKMIDTGEVANATELARRFKLEPGWVSEVLRMTQLAPDIIRAILEGRQPRHLNLHALRGRQAEVPLNWDEQRTLFQFAAPGG